MTIDPRFEPIAPRDGFQFGCHSGVDCFNQCCRDLNQALMPYDVVRLKHALGMSSEDFTTRYAQIQTGPSTGLPVASLRFADHADRTCPFVSPEGCRVYAHRPASCRLYPLARMVKRSRSDGSLSIHYALIREPHCHGFSQQHQQTADRWVVEQGLAPYLDMNDRLMELISLKNRWRPGPLSPDLKRWVHMAFYNIEQLREEALHGRLPDARDLPRPVTEDDIEWLQWGQHWVGQAFINQRG